MSYAPAHEVLSASLFSALQALRPVYVLVDPMGGEPEGWDRQQRRCHSLDAALLRLRPDQAPYLVELEDRHDPLLQESLRQAIQEHETACANGIGAYRFGGWLQTRGGDGAALAQQLSSLMRVNRTTARYLRLADRRVLELLCEAHCLGLHPPAEELDWTQALQGIGAWCWLDRAVQLRTLQGNAERRLSRTLRLDAAHWQLLDQAEALNRGLMLWANALRQDQDQEPERADERPLPVLPTDAVTSLLRKLDRARQRGLRRPADCAAYAVEALRHPGFEDGEGLADDIIEVLAAGQPIDALLARKAAASDPRGRPASHR